MEAVRLSPSKGRTWHLSSGTGGPQPALFCFHWGELKGAGESRTWELDHPGSRVKALILLIRSVALVELLSLSESQFLHLSNGKR